MKNFTINFQHNAKLSILAVAFLMVSFSSCGNVNSNSNVPEMKTAENVVVNSDETLAGNTVSTELEKAKKSGKAVFIVITGKNAVNLEKAIKTAMDAKNKVSRSEMIQLDKDDAVNSSLVTKLGVANVTLPFILVISPKGIPVAGYPSAQATADLLIKSVPSPKQDEVLFAISEKKAVFMVISKKGLSDKSAIIANCKSASAKIASRPAVIEFDFNDAKETAFLKQIGVTSLKEKTKTVVINASGQIADTYDGIVLENMLAASANKVIKSSGCAPGACGSGKSGCK